MKGVMGNNGRKWISNTFNKNSMPIIISKERVNGNNPIETNKEVLLGCPLLPILFNIYTDRVIKDWQQVIIQNIKKY
jgi:hypothetical protein